MKNILCLFVSVLLLLSCTTRAEIQKYKEQQRRTHNQEAIKDVAISKIEYEGHSYIVFFTEGFREKAIAPLHDVDCKNAQLKKINLL